MARPARSCHEGRMSGDLRNVVANRRDRRRRAGAGLLAAGTFGRGVWEILIPASKIAGRIFDDLDGDGIQDARDKGMAGVTSSWNPTAVAPPTAPGSAQPRMLGATTCSRGCLPERTPSARFPPPVTSKPPGIAIASPLVGRTCGGGTSAITSAANGRTSPTAPWRTSTCYPGGSRADRSRRRANSTASRPSR